MEPDSAFPALTSGWKQRLTGTVILDNGRLTAPRFRWADLN